MCEPASHASQNASHASQSASHASQGASHHFNIKQGILLSNCSEYCPNNSTNIQRYCTVLCTVKNMFAIQVAAHRRICHTLALSFDR